MRELPKRPRIYIRIPNWVGDVVMAEPFLRAIRERYPNAIIDVHGRPHLFPFIRPLGYYDEEIPLQRSRGLLWPIKEGLRLKRLKEEPYDLAILLPNSLSSAMIAHAMGARRRVGYRLNGRFFFLTKVLGVRKVGKLRPIPMVSYYLDLAKAVGADISKIQHCPALPVTPEAQKYAEEFLTEKGGKDGKDIWALNMGGAWVTKQWKIDHAARFCSLVIEKGHKVLLLGGPGEEGLAKEVQTRVNSSAIFGMPDAMVPLDKLVAVLKRCRILISTDSGPRHFGIAAGIPVVALIGPTHPGYTGVDYDALKVVCDQAPCWPCHLKKCPLPEPEHHKCMTALTGDRVFHACEELLTRVAQK
ncbi:MAG: lipopolysaccharide heptosyltransferase II [Planctomycetota bacterium]|nr:lipopolysaccharide heptosyltransferase II [Planctomycetota bacterium]